MPCFVTAVNTEESRNSLTSQQITSQVTPAGVEEPVYQNQTGKPENENAVEIQGLLCVELKKECESKGSQNCIWKDQLSRLKNPKDHYLTARTALGDNFSATWRGQKFVA